MTITPAVSTAYTTTRDKTSRTSYRRGRRTAMVAAAGISGKLNSSRTFRPVGMVNHIGTLIKITRMTATKSHSTCWRTVSEPRMKRTIRLAAEPNKINDVTSDVMPSVTAHHGATRKDETPYSGVGPTNMLPRAALPRVSQHNIAQCRLNGFPVGNNCKINGRQQKTPHDQENMKIVTLSRMG